MNIQIRETICNNGYQGLYMISVYQWHYLNRFVVSINVWTSRAMRILSLIDTVSSPYKIISNEGVTICVISCKRSMRCSWKGDSAISSVRDILLPFYIYNMGRHQHASWNVGGPSRLPHPCHALLGGGAKCAPNILLKLRNVGACLISSGRLFQSRVVFGKKEF